MTVLLFGSSLLFLTGCSTSPRTTSLTELGALHPGTSRIKVAADFGRPVSAARDKKGNVVEVYEFIEGAPAAGSAPGTVLKDPSSRRAGTVVTLPQSGALATQTLNGKTLVVQIHYDKRNRIEDTFLLSIKPPSDNLLPEG